MQDAFWPKAWSLTMHKAIGAETQPFLEKNAGPSIKLLTTW